MPDKVQVLGVYTLKGLGGVHLIEVLIHAKPSEFDVGDFTQADSGLPESNWQAAYDELYLSADGTLVIGTDVDLPEEDSAPTRLLFSFDSLKQKHSLITPFGKVPLPGPELLPDRLKPIVTGE